MRRSSQGETDDDPTVEAIYTQRTVPGAVDVRGSSLASAVVVNDGVATRQGDYFHRAVPVDNAAAPQHPQIKVQALDPGAGPGGADLKAEEIGRAYLPKTPEAFTYDFDGNLTGDGRWVYTWDYDNRLIAMESAPSVPATAKRKLEFAYDSRGRRIRKRVHDWNGTAYVLAGERRYAYDGWNLVAEIVASPTPFVRTYVWGLDLSVTEQGAGGVGGLLAIQENGESHYPAYDGNGNVMALVRGSDGAVSGRYEYGPFGELLEVEEDGIANPFRFSTKFQDKETELLYYGFRYYNPETGRWLSVDPIGENGGINLYGFVENQPTGRIDYLGLAGGINYPIPGYNVGPWPKPPPNGPGPLDQFNPGGIRGDSGKKDYTDYFDHRFPKETAAARAAIEKSIESRVRALCYNKGNTVDTSKIQYGIDADKEDYLDRKQNWYERNIVIGSFSMYAENVTIAWKDSDCSHTWTATAYVEELTGVGPGEKEAFFMPLAGQRKVRMGEWANGRMGEWANGRMGEWKLSGGGTCPRGSK